MRHSGRLFPVALAIAASAFGCAAGTPGAGEAADSSTPTLVSPPPEPPLLRVLVAETVVGWTGPGERPFEVAKRTAGSSLYLHQQFGTRTLALPLRPSAPTLAQYPCTTCHQGSRVTRSAAPAHQNIRMDHPRHAGEACGTCHMASAVDRLVLPAAAGATLDQAYRLCAHCHFRQVDDWAAGGHGKRLAGWAGRRVVMNCADCHDPHSPGTESRVPFPGPRIRRGPGGSR
jgi:hypothetical protein